MSISTCQKDYKGKREEQPVAFLGNQDHMFTLVFQSKTQQKHKASTRDKPKVEEAGIALPPKGKARKLALLYLPKVAGGTSYRQQITHNLCEK